MASIHPGRTGPVAPERRASATAGEAPDEMLAPLLAGAFARGVAESLDALGLPGLFLDRSGDVIFMSRAAEPLLQGRLRLHMRHLVANGTADNQALGAFIADAVGEGQAEAALRLAEAGLVLRRLPRSAGSDLAGQMVRAVVLLADEAEPRHVALMKAIA
jgi:hypothetical protein